MASKAFEEGLQWFLMWQAGIAAISADRVYPYDEIPQTAGFPRVVYSIEGTDGTSSVQGDSGLDQITFSLSCEARTRLEADRLATAVRAAMRDLTGPIGIFRVMGGVQFEDRSYATVVPADGSEDGYKLVELTFLTWWQTPLALPRGVT